MVNEIDSWPKKIFLLVQLTVTLLLKEVQKSLQFLKCKISNGFHITFNDLILHVFLNLNREYKINTYTVFFNRLSQYIEFLI